MRIKAVISLVAAVSFCVGLGGYILLSTTDDVAATEFFPPKELTPFILQDQNGHAFTNANLQRHWSLLFLGYTHCPDLCPATLSRLASIYPKLVDSAKVPVQVLFLTADPGQDTAKRLKLYTQFFDPDIVGLRCSMPQLLALTKELGLSFHMDGNHRLIYTASVLLINPKGRLAAVFNPQTLNLPVIDSQQLLHDFDAITAHYL